MKIYYFVFSLLFISLASCSNDQEQNVKVADFEGYYEIVSMNSEQLVDLNNDGIQSQNLYMEIKNPYYLNEKENPISFYNFNQYSSYAEVRPTSLHSTDTQLILLKLPYQNIQYAYSDGVRNIPYLMMYSQDCGSYLYEFTFNDEISLQNITPEARRMGEVVRLKRMNKSEFSVELIAQLFDFKCKEWIATSTVVVYRKVKFPTNRIS